MSWLVKLGAVISLAFGYAASLIVGNQQHIPDAPVPAIMTETATTSATTSPVSISSTTTSPSKNWVSLSESTTTKYTIEDTGVYYDGYTAALLDPKATKVSLDGQYALDVYHVYYKNSEISGADPNTFVVLDTNGNVTGYAKDNDHVYYGADIITSAHALTFKLLNDGRGVNEGFARDSAHIFFNGRGLTQADSSTFVLVSNANGVWSGVAQDARHRYTLAGSGFDVQPLSDTPAATPATGVGATPAAGTSFLDWRWYPLGTHFNATDDYYISYHELGGRVYYTLANRTGTIVLAGADPDTFRFGFSVNEGVSLDYAKDASSVYYQYALVPNADPNSFKPLFDANGGKTYFGKDKDRAYCEADALPGADPNALTVFLPYGGEPSPYAEDSDTAYYCSKPIVGADVLTFSPFEQLTGQFVQIDYSEDKNHVYYQDKMVEGADVATFVTVPNKPSSTYTAQDKNHKYIGGQIVE